ncbi:MAG: AraC family transcriptional regulator [Clostridia bacterium]|nr:AraC family transcriptional regulator [Clostridia bacterium]
MKTVYESDGYQCVLRDGFSDADTLHERHCHPFYEIIMVVSGKIVINIENRRFTVSAGDAVFINPAEYHRISSFDGEEYRRFTLLFEKSLIPSAIRDTLLLKTAKNPVTCHAEMPALMSRLESAVTSEDTAAYAPLIDALVVQLFYTILAGDFLPEDENDLRLQKMLEYISQHETEKITLSDVASYAFISESAVCHIFKSKMKVSFKQYVLQKKIAHAAALIRGGASAAEASRIVGYQNYASFFKIYKKLSYELPSERKEKNK